MTTEKKLTSTRRAVTVNVTQPIIDRSEQKNSNHCMIADAIRAAAPNARAISVDISTIRFTDPEKRQRYIYLTPRMAQLALINFDQGNHVEPFTFQLKKPAQVVASGGKRTLPDGTKVHPSRKTQGIVGASNRQRPTVLGGVPVPKDELNVGGSGKTTKSIAAAEKRAVAAAAAREARATLPKARAAAKTAATKAAADRAKGKPATEASNITLEQSNRRHVREFGLKQLRP